MNQDQVLEIFKEAEALIEGHFLLSSGLHADTYLQCAKVMMDPARAARLLRALAQKLRRDADIDDLDYVISPAMGGVVVGYELARQLGCRNMFTERVDGVFQFRRGFGLKPGARVVMAEDIVTTGLSSRECIACIEAAGGKVVAASCLIDRSGGTADVGVPLVSLMQMHIPAYPADALPPHLQAIPVQKPGSRPQPG